MPVAHLMPELRRWGDRHPLIATSVECVAASAVLLALHGHLALVNVAMLMLLLVAGIAARWGRAPAVLASLWYVLLFDIGFVPPRGSLHVHDAEYLIVFAVMLAVALLVSHFSGQLRDRERAAQAGAQAQRLLYELAAELNRTLRAQQVVEAVVRFLAANGEIAARFLPPDDAPPAAPGMDANEDPARPEQRLLPLQGATRQRGVLELRMPRLAPAAGAARDELLALVAGLMAAALERLHYLEVAARTQVEVEGERLRGTLLASLSHDLRTPLTVLHARAESLREAADAQPALAREAALVCEEAMRANRLCESLLDLAQLSGGSSPLRREWVSLEEIVGAALASLRGLTGGDIGVAIAADLPWLQLDALMFERVIANLVDNARKQGGGEQRISLVATQEAGSVILAVSNTGSRFPPSPAPLLQAFVRGGQADAGGFGLGLAICKAVVEAHGGQITLGNRDDAAEVRIRLPLPGGAMPQPPEVAAGGFQ